MRITYKLTAMNASSAKYGLCEVCAKHVSDVYIQFELEHRRPHQPEHFYWGASIFGHESCLRSARRRTGRARVRKVR